MVGLLLAMREEYISRINRVIDYIENNIDEDFSLKTLSEVACFSQYHFHRIFKAMVNETLNQFILRVKLEKAAGQLLSQPKKSITDIATEFGFSGSAAFARAFKNQFNMNASQWRDTYKAENSKICKTNSNNRKAYSSTSFYIDTTSSKQKWRITMPNDVTANIEVKQMADLDVAYIRHIGPYKGNAELFKDLFTRLMTWAGPRNLINFPETKMLSVYHDNPNITDEDKLRLSVCITVPKSTAVDGEIGKMVVSGGTYAVAHFELSGSEDYEKAWNYIYGSWLPDSGYQPADGVCFESYLNNPEEHPDGIHIVEIYVPLKPL